MRHSAAAPWALPPRLYVTRDHVQNRRVTYTHGCPVYMAFPPIPPAPSRAPGDLACPRAPRPPPRSTMPVYRLCPIYALTYAPTYTRRFRMTWKCIETRSREGIGRPGPPFAQELGRFAQLAPGGWPPGRAGPTCPTEGPAPAPACRPGPPGRPQLHRRAGLPRPGRAPPTTPRTAQLPCPTAPERAGPARRIRSAASRTPPPARPASSSPHDLGGHERGEDMTWQVMLSARRPLGRQAHPRPGPPPANSAPS